MRAILFFCFILGQTTYARTPKGCAELAQKMEDYKKRSQTFYGALGEYTQTVQNTMQDWQGKAKALMTASDGDRTRGLATLEHEIAKGVTEIDAANSELIPQNTAKLGEWFDQMAQDLADCLSEHQ